MTGASINAATLIPSLFPSTLIHTATTQTSTSALGEQSIPWLWFWEHFDVWAASLRPRGSGCGSPPPEFSLRKAWLPGSPQWCRFAVDKKPKNKWVYVHKWRGFKVWMKHKQLVPVCSPPAAWGRCRLGCRWLRQSRPLPHTWPRIGAGTSWSEDLRYQSPVARKKM